MHIKFSQTCTKIIPVDMAMLLEKSHKAPLLDKEFQAIKDTRERGEREKNQSSLGKIPLIGYPASSDKP